MLKYIHHSKKGLKRERNQDKILVIEKELYYLFFVFDGVSSISTSHLFIKYYIQKIRSNIHKLSPSGDNLKKILYDTHNEFFNSDTKIEGMSTLSVLFYNKLDKSAHYISIGDSRIYLFDNQFIEQITTDHSLLNSPNIITKCLGTPELTLDDFLQVEIMGTYNYLICSDGFYKLMESNLMEYFEAYNFKNQANIRKKLSSLQRKLNNDDSSYILIKHEIPRRN